jgi:hypothetical protein
MSLWDLAPPSDRRNGERCENTKQKLKDHQETKVAIGPSPNTLLLLVK